jgi:alkylation response protein AidB-like acyl-CoA dehydrogenase
MQCFGRSLVVEPYVSTVCMGALALVHAGSERHCARLVRDVIEGRRQLALAVAERPHGYLLHEVDTTASKQGSAYELNGTKAVVLGAPGADFIIIPARTSGARRDKQGISLFLVRPNQPGVDLRSYPTIDGRRAAEVSLSKVIVAPEDVIGTVDVGLEPLQQTVNVATLALLGEALGAMSGAIDQTVAYLNVREQFGVKLASFQALRHRVADMVAMTHETTTLVRRAAAVTDGRSAGNAREEIAAAKAYVGRYGMTICKECVQVNGGIAVTDEYIIGHYLKRLVVIDRLFGGVEHQIDTFLEESEAFRL